jgi:ElaB/YqjD/DUF883 family membrane-anchored ribosome-binding protein
MVEERNRLTTQTDETDNERSARRIRKDIAARRESIADTVDQLSDKFQRTLDWRTYAGDYPFIALGIAAGAGLLLSGIFKRKRTPRERIMDAVAESFEELRERFSENLDLAPHKSFDAGKTVKAAATAMLTKAATDYLKNRILGGGRASQKERVSSTDTRQARGVSA